MNYESWIKIISQCSMFSAILQKKYCIFLEFHQIMIWLSTIFKFEISKKNWRNSEKNPSKLGLKTAKFNSKMQKIELFIIHFRKKLGEFLVTYYWFFEFGAVQRCDYFVDLEKCCKMRIWMQKSASIQKRTSLPRFGGESFIFIHSPP